MRRRLWTVLAILVGVALLVLAPGLLLQLAASAFLVWAAQRLFRGSVSFREVALSPAAWVAALAPAAALAGVLATGIGWLAFGVLAGFAAAWWLGATWRVGDLFLSALVLGIAACGIACIALQLVYLPPRPTALFAGMEEAFFRIGVTFLALLASAPVAFAYGGLATLGRRRARLRAAASAAA